jgi:spore coat protein JB
VKDTEVKAVKYENQMSMLQKVQEMEFVAVELNLYLDTHPCDPDALNDFICAAELLKAHKQDYEKAYGPLMNFGFGEYPTGHWAWAEGPWPWEL